MNVNIVVWYFGIRKELSLNMEVLLTIYVVKEVKGPP
jgi:hypothetical protein